MNELNIKDKTANVTESNGAQPAEAEILLTGEKAYGKFNDAESLLNAYNSLQAEFTRRCQRVKELEREINAVKTKTTVGFNNAKQSLKTNDNANISTKSATEFLNDNKEDEASTLVKSQAQNEEFNLENNFNRNEINMQNDANISSEVKRKIIREYLENLKNSKPNAQLTSGNGNAIITPPSKPTSIAEAGNLAKRILENKEIY